MHVSAVTCRNVQEAPLTPLLSAERRQAILDRLEREGKVVAAELVETLGVSDDTIRRDLRALASSGLVERVHGGALPRPSQPPRFVDRRDIDPAGKAAIGAAAARLVNSGDVVLAGGGTTVLQFARALPDDLRATVLTTGPDIAVALADLYSLDVCVIGGRIDPETRTVVGADAVDALRGVRADVCLLGVCSLHPETGLTVPHREEAMVVAAMIAGSERVVVIGGAEKLGTASNFPVAGVEAITTLVTGTNVPEEAVAPYREAGIEVLRA
jgi:DeoR/GlpR family transcriptional regulator of sugar metabolism